MKKLIAVIISCSVIGVLHAQYNIELVPADARISPKDTELHDNSIREDKSVEDTRTFVENEIKNTSISQPEKDVVVSDIETTSIQKNDKDINFTRNPNIIGDKNIGMASWYGQQFAGRTTASGTIFDPKEYTAAHRVFPFGTKVLVTNLKNNHSVIVEINDRGPFVDGRIIDLSQQAAQDIDMISDGVVQISLVRVDSKTQVGPVNTTIAQSVGYSKDAHSLIMPLNKRLIQIGSFTNRENAEVLKKELESYNFVVNIEEVTEKGVYRVLIPRIAQDEIESYVQRLTAIGFPSVLVRIDYSHN